jgi:hypothetical protein
MEKDLVFINVLAISGLLAAALSRVRQSMRYLHINWATRDRSHICSADDKDFNERAPCHQLGYFG